MVFATLVLNKVKTHVPRTGPARPCITQNVTKEACDIVRRVFEFKNDVPGLSTQQILELAGTHFSDVRTVIPLPPRKVRPQKPQPPPEYPLPSRRYLKLGVLESLALAGAVAKFHCNPIQDENGNKIARLTTKYGLYLTVPINDELKLPNRSWLWRWLTQEDKAALGESLAEALRQMRDKKEKEEAAKRKMMAKVRARVERIAKNREWLATRDVHPPRRTKGGSL